MNIMISNELYTDIKIKERKSPTKLLTWCVYKRSFKYPQTCFDLQQMKNKTKTCRAFTILDTSVSVVYIQIVKPIYFF